MGEFHPFLYARPSFSEGAARLLDFGNTLCEYNSALTPEMADDLAIENDWATVGQDLAATFQGQESKLQKAAA